MAKKLLWLILAALLAIPAAVNAQVSPDSRLLQRPELDGANVTGAWLRGETRYQHWKIGDEVKADSFVIGPTFAAPIADDLVELGGRVWLDYFDPQGSSNEWGFSDIDIWGKYVPIDDPFLLSLGMLFTLPTGAEKVVLPNATGEFNFEVFSGLRYYATDVVALIAHMNLRFNSDMDVQYQGVKGEVDGKVSFGIGGGVIFEVSPGFNILGQLDLETERYEDQKNNIELTGGIEYMLNEMVSLNGGLGVGLDKGAPEFEMIGGVNVLF